ncbi:hypothetical protein [uncultured Fibrobacter sp.]|uniref:hypothetical protein n=1 Tax=uncultured Fibrobacter sp. TaxID=261512 RepID=UPI0025CCB49F|nr:hypothetical protein [uncultured Fibrobacter sp.]
MRIILAILLASVAAFSQTVVSVDADVYKNRDKNVFLAVGASALLPGMGELYLNEKKMVRPFVWTDLALWVAAIGSYVVGDRYVTSAHNYAVRHAGFTGNKSVALLNTVGSYRSRSGVFGQNSSPDMDEDYNQAMIRSGKKVDEEFSSDVQWDWGSSDNPETTEHIDEFKSRMRHYRVSRIVFQVSVGALILNRVVSMLDAIRVYRATSSKSFSERVQFEPEFYQDGGALLMNVKF